MMLTRGFSCIVLVGVTALSNANTEAAHERRVTPNDPSPHHFNVTLRGRLATIDQDSSVRSDSAHAASLLVRTTLTSSWSTSLSTGLELDYVASGFKDHHSDGVRFNGKPWITDAPGLDLNQLWLRWQSTNGFVQAGRQALALDNQRFIGGSSFWQNEQTFDALQIGTHIGMASTWQYVYINRANRIFGRAADESLSQDDVNFTALNGKRPDQFLGAHAHNTHLLRLELNEWDHLQAVVYGYWIDNKDLPVVSNQTLGGRLQRQDKLGAWHIKLDLELARQRRQDINTTPQLGYYALEASLGRRSLDVAWRSEIHTAEQQVAFATPLGSLHEFNGWADKFLVLPAQGLRDHSLRLRWRNAPFKLFVAYHYFETYQSRTRLGEELDLEIAYSIAKQQHLTLRTAHFRAARNQEDTLISDNRGFLTYTLTF